MAKFTLDIEDDFDFKLIGIFSHVKDYRLSWQINQEFEFDLQKEENLTVKYKNNIQEHSFFCFFDEENLLDYYLISNRSESGMLIPEEKCDYFLLIKGHIRDQQFQELIKKTTQLKHILTTSNIEVEELKSKENLIF
jgi:hypothetical protein